MPGGIGSSGMPGGSGSSGMPGGFFGAMGGSSDESTESETDESAQDDIDKPQLQPQNATDILKAGSKNRKVLLIMACSVLVLIVGAVALYSYGSKQGSLQGNSSYLKAKTKKSRRGKRRRTRN